MKYIIGFIVILLLASNAIFLSIILAPKQVIQPALTVVPSDSPTPTPINLSAEILLSVVNDWRLTENLQPYTKDQRLCTIAEDRVLNDPVLDNHEGLGLKYANYPYVIQENLATDYSEPGMLEGWLSSPGHAETLRKPYTHSCIYCKGNYCSQIFSSF